MCPLLKRLLCAQKYSVDINHFQFQTYYVPKDVLLLLCAARLHAHVSHSLSKSPFKNILHDKTLSVWTVKQRS